MYIKYFASFKNASYREYNFELNNIKKIVKYEGKKNFARNFKFNIINRFATMDAQYFMIPSM